MRHLLPLVVVLGMPVLALPQQQGEDSEKVVITWRADEKSRDPHSKPEAVYDFLGIGEGNQVADILAGGGYNTYLLSRRVGPSGRVYAERASSGLRARLKEGDLKGATNVVVVDSLSQLPTGTLDAVVMVRAYHLFQEYEAALAELYRALTPGGTVGIVEVRLNKSRGHDMQSHRMGEETVIEQLTEAGFEYVAQSDLLRRENDDYTIFRQGERHMTDRMLMKFRKSETGNN